MYTRSLRWGLAVLCIGGLMGAKGGCGGGGVTPPKELCSSSGGTWNSNPGSTTCWPLACGEATPDCSAASKEDGVCKCPSTKPYWQDGQGCQTVEDCYPNAGLCKSTGGTWDSATTACWSPACGETSQNCPAGGSIGGACQCPADKPYWTEGKGCRTLEQCYPNAALCRTTGGTWDLTAACWPPACGQTAPNCPAGGSKGGACGCPTDKPYWKEGEGCWSLEECNRTCKGTPPACSASNTCISGCAKDTCHISKTCTERRYKTEWCTRADTCYQHDTCYDSETCYQSDTCYDYETCYDSYGDPYDCGSYYDCGYYYECGSYYDCSYYYPCTETYDCGYWYDYSYDCSYDELCGPCKGTPTACESYLTRTSCATQPGCQWL